MNEQTKSPADLGISQQDALKRLEMYGFNELEKDRSKGIGALIYSAVREPMVMLLLCIGLLYSVLGEAEDVYSLLFFLVLIVFISVYHENRTERTLSSLKKLTSPRAVVFRDGIQVRIPGREVVPDDIVVLNEGDRVPADLSLLQGGPLSVDESIITGESFPVDKSASAGDTALSGTLILKGQALGRVLKTGDQTELGRIGKSLGEDSERATLLQLATRKLVKKLSVVAGALTVFIIMFFWLTRNELMNGVLVGLTLAMAILPNELPAVLFIFLAAGAWRISKRNVLTRRVPAIEDLGAISYLCVDKTGTLTQNKMILRCLWNTEEKLNITGLNQDLPDSFHALMEFGILASPLTPFDPMERAIQETGKAYLNHTEHLHPDWKMSKEYQMTNELLAVSYAWKGEKETGHTIGAKGAVEDIMDLCHLPQQRTKEIELEMKELASLGLRVIAVARSSSIDLPEKLHDLPFEFIGLVGFEDPIREDAKASVLECQQAGIKVVMMTGDHPVTAVNVALQIGLTLPHTVLTGKDLQSMDDQTLKEQLSKVRIFCRMKPLDKLRVVSLLQELGEVVAMTGDGVNDAPALKKAQIGIAMGKRGSDVAREASSVVLIDDSFASIAAAIRIGRRIYKNLQSAFSYLLAIHIPITVLSIVPVVFNFPLIFLPVHIAFLHLIIEPASTILFEAIPDRAHLMDEKPRSKKLQILSTSMVLESLVGGAIISLAVLSIFLFTLHRGFKPSDARGITFTTLILCNLFYIFIMEGESLVKKSRKDFLILCASSLTLLGLIVYVPIFRELFRFEPLHITDLLACLVVSLSSGVAVYVLKKILKAKRLA